ncbi:hypothetical protein DL89DRAFT_41571 [Linderina pennispora]|uniref:Uncharacterized protein n=1 Tax=Linderina pennispora TaxID=61395 RepID=A0A1Y1VTB7_9FUNG|nr:uncharacterized protein DL89DRAFT_41571 [Linderina pennispora]ORX64255.1 hypothetical protein DL89DRAFT_41571 [Linderina pennispora]
MHSVFVGLQQICMHDRDAANKHILAEYLGEGLWYPRAKRYRSAEEPACLGILPGVKNNNSHHRLPSLSILALLFLSPLLFLSSLLMRLAIISLTYLLLAVAESRGGFRRGPGAHGQAFRFSPDSFGCKHCVLVDE